MPIKKNVPIIHAKNSFSPIELTEYNVNILYDHCLASEEEIKERKDLVFAQAFMDKYTGNETSLSIFSKKKLEKRKQSIEYLLGQIPFSLTDFDDFKTFRYNYKNEEWTDSFIARVKLFDMGIALNILTPLKGIERYPSFQILSDIPKTLSPKDPNFPEWYKTYQRDVLKEEPKELDEK